MTIHWSIYVARNTVNKMYGCADWKSNQFCLLCCVYFFLQEQFIPIDIHTNKLSDWLLSRRHCKREWQTQILSIREKINNAIQDMPVHGGITKLLSGSCTFMQLNEYYHLHLVQCKGLIGFGFSFCRYKLFSLPENNWNP